MSYLAIGAVTKAIVELLGAKLNKPPLLGTDAKFRVTAIPPDDDRIDDGPGINVFLFRVSDCPYGRNMDWPGDRDTPGGKWSALNLVLDYLVTAYGKKSEGPVQDDVSAHHLLGNAMAILHENPVLNGVHDGDFDADRDSQFPAELRRSFSKIRVTPLPFQLEELSKIWTGLGKPYRLSVAYEVHLAQIAPVVLAPMPAPLVMRTGVAAETIAAPSIESVDPPSGPAGATVALRGGNFRAPGRATAVRVGETDIPEAELTRVTDTSIVLTVPEAPLRGPKLAVVVSSGGRESAAASYEVRPWLPSIQPLRGPTGIPLTLVCGPPPGALVEVEAGGKPAAATVSPSGQSVAADVPDLASNGPQAVVLIVDGKRSNARIYEVLPEIESVALAAAADPLKKTLTVQGRRLNGRAVHIRYGGSLLAAGPNANATEVSLEVDGAMAAGQPARVIVDGRESNLLPPRLDAIEPPSASPGEPVVLTGQGLAGAQVGIEFGATGVAAKPNPYSSRIESAVPPGLAAGKIKVRAKAHGSASNELDFEVLG